MNVSVIFSYNPRISLAPHARTGVTRSYLIYVLLIYTCTIHEYQRYMYNVHRVSWVRVPPKAAHFLGKRDCLGCAVLLCLVVCLTLLASFSFFLL